MAPRRTVTTENYTVPMEPVENYHDHGAKTFLGQFFPAGQTARQDLEQARENFLFAELQGAHGGGHGKSFRNGSG